jgi:alpha-tubulin suppressor-like RCC1 family protein
MRQFNCVQKMALGQSCAIFLRKDYTLSCVGRDSYNNLLNSTVPDTGTPSFSGKPTGEFIEVAAGYQFCLAISRDDGHLERWGVTDAVGEISTPPSGVFMKIAACYLTAMALKIDGSLEVWRGPSSEYDNDQVADKPTSGVYTAIACGKYHCLALTNDGKIKAWGTTGAECDIGTESGDYRVAPSGYIYTAIAAGDAVSYTLRTNGTNVILERWDNYPTQIPAAPTPPIIWTKIVAQSGILMALRSDGTIAVSGVEYSYHTGGSTGQLTIPTNKNCDIKDIACGYSHCAVLKHTGGVLSWGENLWGVCASWHNKCFKAAAFYTIGSAPWGGMLALIKTDGTLVFAGAGENFMPKPLPRVYGDFVKVVGGGGAVLALTSAGECYGFGVDSYNVIADIPSDETFIDIALGNTTAFGITSDGTLVGWGNNADGFISNMPSGTFTKVSVNLEGRTAVAIRSDGSLAVWHQGDPEDPNYENLNEFGPDTPEENDFVAVSAGFVAHAMALRSDKTVAVWGRKSNPQDTYTNSPAINEEITEIAAGSYFNVVLYENSTIAVWGQILNNINVIPEPNLDFIHIATRVGTIVGIKGVKDTFKAVAWGYNAWSECEVGL